ncbi:unnamed protein product [Microthlaspi erraticum]|uniref:Retrotransposon gag domain-containing protein n=1 Tax=Microthlaspi erraticum TaxID=1685480 RepID=A0A6D2KVL6_9BRAS|nr:unnamed protein product [Microthlaspi erraticum]
MARRIDRSRSPTANSIDPMQSKPARSIPVLSQPFDQPRCMNTRSRRSNRNEELLILSNAELARVERANRQRRPNPADMGDNGNPNMAAQLQQLQQQIEQMRKAQQDRERNLRQDFEIKPGMIALVKDHIFHGLPAEIPADHIQNFEEICSTTGSNGVPADFLKCKLFPFSLANKASRWLKSLPPGL